MITVTPQAAAWYKKELHLKDGDHVKFFGKIYGARDGFSFTIGTQEPTRPELMINVEGINFYVEKSDAWFFDDFTLLVDLDDHYKEPTFITQKK